MASVTGKVNQNHFNPNLEKTYARGTKRTIVLKTVKSELITGCSVAWKKTGKIRDVTIPRKLIPTIFNPHEPILITSGSDVKTPSICDGIAQKHIVPVNISAVPRMIETIRVLLHRFISFLA